MPQDTPATVDLNADVGEGFGRWRLTDDEALLDVVSSANVACGFHAGDPSTMRRLCLAAHARGVSIGAHVGYRDLAGFGRRFVDVAADELRDDVVYQVAALVGTAASVGARVRYVKPHGALYNAIVHHHDQARAVVEAVAAVDPTLPLLGLPGSVVLDLAAAAGLRTVTEAFGDRAYTAQGTLVPRGVEGAVLHDVDEVVARCLAMATGRPVEDIGGAPLQVTARSLCLHGDTPGAVTTARGVREALDRAGVAVSAFA
ncbi:LamB/YcsF family protein [Aquipuribacter sp. MA13-6]|uniref:LamB/YcsF family protein n=1 Tax=unclassified Aquipuribacter TaxID=2635084 RepID=UPI003EEEB8EF